MVIFVVVNDDRDAAIALLLVVSAVPLAVCLLFSRWLVCASICVGTRMCARLGATDVPLDSFNIPSTCFLGVPFSAGTGSDPKGTESEGIPRKGKGIWFLVAAWLLFVVPHLCHCPPWLCQVQ